MLLGAVPLAAAGAEAALAVSRAEGCVAVAVVAGLAVVEEPVCLLAEVAAGCAVFVAA